MSATSTDVANLALLELAETSFITDLASENTKPANVMRLLFDQVVGEVLELADWPFARRRAQLALVTDMTTDDDAEWGYSYRLPSDALVIRRFWNGADRVPSLARTVRHLTTGDASGRLIYTDDEYGFLWYTARIDSPGLWSALFTRAVITTLAAQAAFALCGERAEAIKRRCEVEAAQAIARAAVVAYNEEKDDAAPDGDLLTSRA